MARLWIVTPVFWDVTAFRLLRADVLAIVGADPDLAGFDVHFVVVDDTAGRDRDMRTLVQEPGGEILTPPFNVGHQRAIVFALRRIEDRVGPQDVVVTLDSDGEDRPQDIPDLLRALRAEEDPSTVVLARRSGRQESLTFKAGYRIFMALFRVLTGTVIRTGNFAAYGPAVLPVIRRHPYFNISYSASLTGVGFPVQYVRCPRGRRYAGESRMNFQRLMLHGLSMLVPFTDRIALRAMFLFTMTVVVSVALAVAVVAVKLLTTSDVPGWATYTLLALFLASLTALGNFIVLFFVFSQARGTALADLEEVDVQRP